MINSRDHISLNGIKYKLAQSEEGDHYMKSAETLRPANAVVVQGEGSNQKFQLRPDVLAWHWTDWSAGEGQNKVDFNAPARSRELNGVSAFLKPGNLRPGNYVEDTQLHSAGGDLDKSVVLVKARSALLALDKNAVDAWQWNAITAVWDDVTITGPSNGAEGQGAGDESFIYFIEDNTRNLWKWPGSGACTKIDDAGSHTDTQYLAELGAFVYVYSPQDGELLEVPKDGSASVVLASSGIAGGTPAGGAIVEMGGKIYFMATDSERIRIHEVVPSTAAGEGYVSVLATMEGLEGLSLWAHSGTLYFIGDSATISGKSETAIMYVTPGGDWGSLGSVRGGKNLGPVIGQSGSSRILDHFFVVHGRDVGTTNNQTLFQIDTVSGGFGAFSINDEGDAKQEAPASIQVMFGDIFWSTRKNTATKRISRAYVDSYQKISSVISPWHDFDLADEKILSSLTLSMSALPTDWTINVDYALNGSSSWTVLIINAVDNSEGGRTQASTSGSTVSFRRARFRIRMEWTGGGIPTTFPEIYGLEIRAQIAKPLNTWVLLLDLNDDKSSGPTSKSGATKIANIEAAAAGEKVVAFFDGYQDRHAGVFGSGQHVVIDSYRIILGRPGEGYVQVRIVSVA